MVPKRFKITFPFRPKSKSKPKNARDFISELPDELLVCIYQQLETVECTSAFSRTCVSFRHVAVRSYTKAAWVVTRYGSRFALYYALLSIPERCDATFIEYLFSFGAHVPRYLVQALVQVYGKPVDSASSSEQRRRRRSSFDQCELDLFFLKAIQKIPFSGYALLMQRGAQLFISSLDTATFNEQIWNMLIKDQYFFPAPITDKTTTTYRHVLKLATISPATFDLIAPVFDFDPLARSCLWESILLLFFDEAFRSTSPTGERLAQLESIEKSVIVQRGKDVHLLGPLTDQQIFCQVFAHFFTKYPVGYCHQRTMTKLLDLLKRYVKPNFDIRIALEHMVHIQLGRSDTIESLDKFLKERV
ncbi:hypothetical protein K501DRAFT_258147 [Backusella circina FSU 941]|nr:hypothetical protein K501DRAFT_258147 [Backusella circina FSU 941]